MSNFKANIVEHSSFEVNFYDYFKSPCLIRIFDENRSRDYEPHTLEKYSDIMIYFMNKCKTITKYLVPIFGFLWYRNKQNINSETIQQTEDSSDIFFLFQWKPLVIFGTMFALYCGAQITRAYMRSQNPVYVQFARTLKTASTPISAVSKKNDDIVKTVLNARNKLRHEFEFDFNVCPIDFSWKEGLYHNRTPQLLALEKSGGYPFVDGSTMMILSKLMATTVGRCILYPGSIGLLQRVLSNALRTGRNFLIEKKRAQRFKLEARDNNSIDCIVVDRRNSQKDNDYFGNNLVICSEGNAGFYEIGIMSVPLEKDYSVMGWNHPGFGFSSGTPYPINDLNAIDVVINFATTKLGFPLENIFLFGWSIGGFPTAWAASQYPEIKGVILDASFDDVLPLARARMMKLLSPIVDHTIRYHFNLNVSAYLNLYKGPVLLIRRLQDEILSIDYQNSVSTNCGNQILIKLLAVRYPKLFESSEMKRHLNFWLETPNNDRLIRSIDRNEALKPIIEYIYNNNVTNYPVNILPDNIQKETIYLLADFTMGNYNSTHCTPLPPAFFKKPFDLFEPFKTEREEF